MEKELNLTPSSFDKIRFYDCDPFGHLNNSRYLDYIINARENHLTDEYDLNLNDFYKKGLAWVVASHEIVYLKPARFNEKVCIQTSLLSLNEHSVMVEGIMFDERKTIIKTVLWTKLTHVDLTTGKKREHPPEFMDFAKKVLNLSIDGEGGLTKRVQRLLEK
ncbi:acyl-CoA thioesterase [Flavitalea flava]